MYKNMRHFLFSCGIVFLQKYYWFTFSTSCLNSENEMPCTEVQHAYTLSLNNENIKGTAAQEIIKWHHSIYSWVNPKIIAEYSHLTKPYGIQAYTHRLTPYSIAE
jgi:hypothetical protein